MLWEKIQIPIFARKNNVLLAPRVVGSAQPGVRFCNEVMSPKPVGVLRARAVAGEGPSPRLSSHRPYSLMQDL